MIQGEWAAMKEHLFKALDIVNRFEVPLAAWRVHGVASEFYERRKKRLVPNNTATVRLRSSSPWLGPSTPTNP